MSLEHWQQQIRKTPDVLAADLSSRLSLLSKETGNSVIIRAPEQEECLSALTVGKALGGALSGLPYAVKDLYWDGTDRVPAAGSSFLPDVLQPKPERATLLRKLDEEGAVPLVRSQLNEFAYGLSGRNAHFGDCPHPRLPGALCGGSSSGSAHLVAGDYLPFALGTDTAGSIRVPAAFCGLFGVRLTPDHWSMEGIFPLAPGFDTAGWLSRDAATCLALLEALLGPGSSRPPRLLYHPNFAGGVVDGKLAAALAGLAEGLGARMDSTYAAIIDHELSRAGPIYAILQSREAWAVHENWLDSMRKQYSEVVWQRIDRGRHWSKEEIRKASERRDRMIRCLRQCFQGCDCLLVPVAPTPTPTARELDQGYRERLLDLNTAFSLAGLPALTLPVTLEDGRSGALQCIFPSLERASWRWILENLPLDYQQL